VRDEEVIGDVKRISGRYLNAHRPCFTRRLDVMHEAHWATTTVSLIEALLASQTKRFDTCR
jgi:hypothetical protein